MNNSNSIKKCYFSTILSFLVVLLCLPAFSQTTITGQNGTNVSNTGSVYNITTTDVYQNFAVNTFSEFTAVTPSATAVNFHHPAGRNFLINRINTSGTPAQIGTVVNSVLADSTIGGTMMFACPNGIIIDANAQINVGSLILTTANNINFLSTDSNNYDLMDSSVGGMPNSEGINPAGVITFGNSTAVNRNTIITNDGIINANGLNTFNGEPASVGIFAEEIQNNGVVRLEDSGTPILDGTIDMVTASTAEYSVTTNAEGHHFVPTTASEVSNMIINYGTIENAGQIIAREGTVHLASSHARLSGLDPELYSTVINSGSINVDAVNPNSAAGNVDLFAFHNSSYSHGASVTNIGSISAQNSLAETNPSTPGEVTIAAENINLQPASSIDVTGINSASRSGIVRLGPSGDTGCYDSIVIGDTAPAAETALYLNNDTFEMIDNSISVNPPTVDINASSQVTFDGLSIQQNGLDVLIGTDNFYGTTANPTFETISSLKLIAGDNIDFNGRVLTANFDTYGNYDKKIEVECQSFSLDSGAGIDLISTGANYPIIMNVNSIFYGSGSGMINNWESGSGDGGILMISHRTTVPGQFELRIDSTGIDVFHIPTTTPSDLLNFSNLSLGTSGGTLIVGDPINGTFEERIIVDGLPTNSYFDNGKIHFHTNYLGATAPIDISNADFTAQNIDLILSVKDNLNLVSVNASTNNNFGNVAVALDGNVGANIIDQDGGINIAPIAAYIFDTTTRASELSFSTPLGAAGDINIEGEFGEIYLNSVDAGPSNDIDIITYTGSIQFSGSNTINGQNIRLEIGATGQDINLYGNINSNNGLVEIINNNSTTGRINIEASSNITLTGNDINTGIELISMNELNIRGPVSAQLDTTSGMGMTQVIASSPDLNIYTQSGSNGYLEGIATTGANPVSIVVETDNFYTDATGSTPVITSYNAGGTTGLLFIDRFSPAGISIGTAGIDLNTGGNDLLFENINLGSSDARLAFTSFAGTTNIQTININGVPSNSLGSFDNGVFLFKSEYTGAVGSAIAITNANFEANNQSVILDAPSTTFTAVDTTNTNFGNLSIRSPGTANIEDMAGNIILDTIFGPYLSGTMEVTTLNVNTGAASTGDIIFNGRVEDISANAHNGGDIDIFSVANMLVRNSSAPGGNIDIETEGLLTIASGNTVSANNVYIYTNAAISDDIIINGTIQTTNGDIEIRQDNSLSDITIGSTGLLRVNTNTNDNSIFLTSAGRIIISGDLILQDSTPGGSYDNGIELEAPVIQFDNSSTPSINAESTSAIAPTISLITDNVINGTTLFSSPPLIRSVNNSGEEGVLVIDRFSNGNIAFDNSGIDFNGGGADLIWQNMNLGTSYASLFFGDTEVPTDGHIQIVNILGAPTNTYGSFIDGLTFITALYTGSSNAINVSNANFAANTNSLVLKTINTPVGATYGINAVTNNDFAYLSIDTAGTARISDIADGIMIDEYEFDGSIYQSKSNTLQASTSSSSNGTLEVKGDFVRASLASGGIGNIIFTDINGGIVIDNANANNGLASIKSTNDLTVSAGANVVGKNVLIENIPDNNGNTNGIIEINGRVSATDGNVDILTAKGDVIIGSTGIVEASSVNTSSGNVKISKSASPGELRVNLQDGFGISAGTDPNNKNKSVILGDTNFSTPVIVTGSQTGNVAINSPYSTAIAYKGSQGNIQAGDVRIAISGQPMPEPPPEPTPPAPDPIPDPTPVPPAPTPDPDEPNIPQEAIDEAEYAISDSEGNVIFVEENGEVLIYDNDSGNILSLTEDGDNVFQEDFSDDSSSDSFGVVDGNSLLTNSFDLDTGSDSISLGSDDSTGDDSSTGGTGSDGTDTELSDSSEDSDSNSSESEDSISDDNELAEGDGDDDSNDDDSEPKSSSGGAVLEALDSNDEPMNSEDVQVMRTVFGICQGSGACSNIDTPEGNALLHNTTNLSTENELSADQHGTRFIADAGYHPAGLEGFLMTLKRIEEITKKHGINEYGQDVTPVFSYRHPKTTDRISLIENQLQSNGLTKNNKVRLNIKTYRSIVKDIK